MPVNLLDEARDFETQKLQNIYGAGMNCETLDSNLNKYSVVANSNEENNQFWTLKLSKNIDDLQVQATCNSKLSK